VNLHPAISDLAILGFYNSRLSELFAEELLEDKWNAIPSSQVVAE